MTVIDMQASRGRREAPEAQSEASREGANRDGDLDLDRDRVIELERLVGHSRPERAATWAGTHVDALVRRALRSLFMRRGVPYMSPEELDRSFAMLRCYSDPEVLADPDRLLAPPGRPPAMRVIERKPIRGGVHLHYTFASPYQPVHPLYAAEFRRYDRLDTVHLFAWKHARPAPVSLLVTHGWGLGSKRVHELEFGIDLLFRQLGIDVYYYVAPFHWVRKPTAARFSGELHPSPNLMRTNEAFVQTAQEIRTVIGAILDYSSAPLGMMGSSLGGYTTAFIASIDDRLSFAIPVLPMASLADLFWDHGHGDPVRAQVERMGMSLERLRSAWALHSPLSHRPKVPWHGRFIVSATGDGIVTARHTEELWHHWDRPRHRRFAGGHILQVFRGHYHRDIGRFLADMGLLSSTRLRLAGLG